MLENASEELLPMDMSYISVVPSILEDNDVCDPVIHLRPRARLCKVLSESSDLGLFPNDLLSLAQVHEREERIAEAYIAYVQYLQAIREVIPRDRPIRQSEARILERHLSSTQNLQNVLLEQFCAEDRVRERDRLKQLDPGERERAHNQLVLSERIPEDVTDPLEDLADSIWELWNTSIASSNQQVPQQERILGDPTDFSFERLNEILQTSKNTAILERCQQELTRRSEIINQWKAKKEGRYRSTRPYRSGSLDSSFSSSSTSLPDLQRDLHRYFHRTKRCTSDPNRKRFWYCHFIGEKIVRELEVSLSKPPRLFVDGDAELSKKTLTELGLPLVKGAEIPREKFELVWQRYGGRPWLYSTNT